jgi:hypothetical protein
MGGISTSSTRLLTMVPKAPPMMMPTAMSTTLPRMAKVLNSFNIGISSVVFLVAAAGHGPRPLLAGQPFVASPVVRVAHYPCLPSVISGCGVCG